MALPVNEIEFSSDTAHRKQWFRGCSFSHPAKMHLSLQFYLIEHYTKPGDTILDCMSGSGTLLVACALGRNVICVELEKKFVDMQKANWQKIKALGPILGYKMGEAVILQGDARNLESLLADSCIFSPPYGDPIGITGGTTQTFKDKYGYTGDKNIGYSENKNNIGNLPYGEISAVISSPPYAEAHDKKIGGVTDKNRPDLIPYSWTKSGNPNNISNLPYKPDVICTSLPYENITGKGKEIGSKGQAVGPFDYTSLDPSVERLRNHGRTDPKSGGPYGRSLAHPYSPADENIGNLKSENYLQAMSQVYQNCFKVLRDGGLLILVVKNFIRNKKIIHLDTDTIKLCESAGFALKERLKRKLTQQSFWRIIYYRKYPDAPKIEFEDILIFQK